jgi:hypothetical protein
VRIASVAAEARNVVKFAETLIYATSLRLVGSIASIH